MANSQDKFEIPEHVFSGAETGGEKAESADEAKLAALRSSIEKKAKRQRELKEEAEKAHSSKAIYDINSQEVHLASDPTEKEDMAHLNEVFKNAFEAAEKQSHKERISSFDLPSAEQLEGFMGDIESLKEKASQSGHFSQAIFKEYLSAFGRLADAKRSQSDNISRSDYKKWKEFQSGKGRLARVVKDNPYIFSPEQAEQIPVQALEEALNDIDFLRSRLDRKDKHYKELTEQWSAFRGMLSHGKGARKFPPSAAELEKWKRYVSEKEEREKEIERIAKEAEEAPKQEKPKSRHELFMEKWAPKLSEIQATVARLDEILKELPRLFPRDHMNMRFPLAEGKASFGRIIRSVSEGKIKHNLDSADLDKWEEIEKKKGRFYAAYAEAQQKAAELETAKSEKKAKEDELLRKEEEKAKAEQDDFIKKWEKKIPVIEHALWCIDIYSKYIDEAEPKTFEAKSKKMFKSQEHNDWYYQMDFQRKAFARVLDGLKAGKPKSFFNRNDLEAVEQFEKETGRLFKILDALDKEKREADKLKKQAPQEEKKEEVSEVVKEWHELFARISDDPKPAHYDKMWKCLENLISYTRQKMARHPDAADNESAREYLGSFERVLGCIYNETAPAPEDLARVIEVFEEEGKNEFEYVEEPQPEAPEAPAAPASPEARTDFAPPVAEKMAVIGVTAEMLASIPGFENISESDAKVLWMLNKFDEVKVRTLRNDAAADVEKETREKSLENGWLKTWGRNRTRAALIESRMQELAKEPFDFEKYRGDIADLVHLADAAPDMVIIESEGEAKVVVEYVENIQGIDQKKLDAFNISATAYAAIPPEYEWKNLSPKQVVEYEKIRAAYDVEKEALLKLIPQHIKSQHDSAKSIRAERYSDADAMRMVNAAEFSVKMHQNLNRYPSAELELMRLAQSEGLKGKWEAVKAQLGVGGPSGMWGGALGFAAGSAALRWGSRSALVIIGASGALPIAALGIGGFIGWKRGAIKGKEQLRKEEELMRLGLEEQTSSRKQLPKLNAKFEERRAIKAEIDVQAHRKRDPAKMAKLAEKLEAVDKEISRLRGTDQNFAKAETLISKIQHLETILPMNYTEYQTYIRSKGDAQPTVDFNQFEAKKKDWAEQLEVRLEYTKRKLDEGKISFGSDRPLGMQLELVQSMGRAAAELAVLPRHDGETKLAARRQRLGGVLSNIEERIAENQDQFVRRQQRIGAMTGVGMSAVGFMAGHALSGAFHDIAARAHALKAANFIEGKEFEGAVARTVKEEMAFKNADELIRDARNTPVEADIRTVSSGPLPDIEAPRVPRITRAVLPEDPSFFKDRSFAPVPEAAPTAPEIPAAAPEAVPKPFEVTLTRESQSRESALIKYFESKGMEPGEAGSKAHRYMIDNFGRKGERALGWVRKGDTISITEDGGKIKIEVNHAENVPTQRIVPEQSRSSLPRATERASAASFRTSSRAPSGLPEAPLPVRGPLLPEGTPGIDFSQNDLTATINETLQNNPDTLVSALSHYEVTAPSDLPSVLEAPLSADPRYAGLSEEAKDKFLFQLFMRQYIDPAQSAVSPTNPEGAAKFYKSLGIASGNPLDIQKGTLRLDRAFGADKDVFGSVLKDVQQGKVPAQAVGFRRIAKDLAEQLKEIDPNEMNRGMIVSTIARLRQ